MYKTNSNPVRWFDPVAGEALSEDRVEADDDKPCSVYYIHNAEHELLYVGISISTMARMGQHATDKQWWPEVAYISVEHMPTVDHARHREAFAIQKLNPRYNIARPPYDGCENCGELKGGRYKDLCGACYQYRSRYGRPRPERLWNRRW